MRLSGSVKLYCARGSGVGLGGVGSFPHGFFPAARQFGGDVQRLLALLRLGLLGPRHEFFYFQFQLFEHRARAPVAHGGMFAGVGLDPRPVHADRADFGQAQVLGQLEHAHERGAEGGFVGRAESADRIVIGMSVGAEVTHGHGAGGRGFDGPGAEASGGVAVDEQRQHHGRSILLAARAAVIDVEVGGGNLLHRINDEMDDVTLGHPLAQITRQEHRRLPVNVDETCGHDDRIAPAAVCSKHSQKSFPSQARQTPSLG